MPTYEYSCNDCGHQFDVVQSIHDDSLTTCPNCGGNLRKLFGNVGVVFKGSGFYKTDSRESGKSKKAATAAKPAAESTTSSSSEGSTSTSKDSSTPAAPAAQPAASTSSSKPSSD
ncbi:MAG: FmdB family zinc ribbon protein [Candidatus Nanopelagicales bacterium]